MKRKDPTVAESHSEFMTEDGRRFVVTVRRQWEFRLHEVGATVVKTGVCNSHEESLLNAIALAKFRPTIK